MTTPAERLSLIYAQHVDHVYGYLLARCGSVQLAEDITGITFEHAAIAFARDEASVTISWLLTVGRRRLIDHWRRAAMLRERLDVLGAEQLSVGLDLQGSDRMSGRDSAVMAALESLPMRQRAALALRYLEEYSVAEVADALDTTYRAAESLLSRARRAFKIAHEEAV